MMAKGIVLRSYSLLLVLFFAHGCIKSDRANFDSEAAQSDSNETEETSSKTEIESDPPSNITQSKIIESSNNTVIAEITISDLPQILSISEGSLKGTSVTVPPGTLTIGTTVELSKGENLLGTELKESLGISSELDLKGESLVLESSQEIPPSTSLNVTIPGITTASLVDDGRIVVLYTIETEDGEKVGVIENSRLDVSGSFIRFKFKMEVPYKKSVFQVAKLDNSEPVISEDLRDSRKPLEPKEDKSEMALPDSPTNNESVDEVKPASPTAFQIQGVRSNRISLSWTGDTNHSFLLVAKGGETPDFNPEDGIEYSVALDAQTKVLFAGKAGSFDHINGVGEGDHWYYKLYSYNDRLQYSEAVLINQKSGACEGLDNGSWVLVPGDSDFGTLDFCVMKYEAKNEGENAVSKADTDPWTGLSQEQAKAKCNAIGPGYALISNQQWMTLASNIAENGANWTGGSSGSGQLIQGHSDANPGKGCPASEDDTLAFVEGDCTPKAEGGDLTQKRTHILSNSAIIWDVSGNVSNWTSYFEPEGKPQPDGNSNHEFTAISNGQGTLKRDIVPEQTFKSWWNDNWDSTDGIGLIHPGESGSGGALQRGSSHSLIAQGGVFSTGLLHGKSHSSSLTGFRCVAHLHETLRFNSFIGEWGVGEGQFKGPTEMALDSNDNVYVADYNNHRVQVFDDGGDFQSTFGSQGSGNGQFDKVGGVAIDSSGYIYVADPGNDRIQKFDSEHNFVAILGSYGTGPGQFNYPFGITIDKNGNFFVTDTDNHRIQKFDSNFTHIATFGGSGDDPVEFNRPKHITIDEDGDILVSDNQNHRIQVFDSSLNFKKMIGGSGSTPDKFDRVGKIVINPNGTLYVTYRYNDRIKKLDANLDFMHNIGSEGNTQMRFDNPFSLLYQAQTKLWVTEFSNHRIQVLDVIPPVY